MTTRIPTFLLVAVLAFTMAAPLVPAQPPVFFSETFDNNNAGWTLDPEWAIGPAVQGPLSSCGFPDPGSDADGTPGGGVAGVVLGGAATNSFHPAWWLTSPVFDTTGLGGVQLDFDRFLNSEYPPFMYNSIQVFDGSSWVTIWDHTASTFITESQWSHHSYNLSIYSNANFQVRFGVEVQAFGGLSSCSSWNLDNFVISDPGPSQYQINTPSASLDVDGVQGDPFTPAVVNTSVITCPTGITPATPTVSFGSDLPGPMYEIALSPLNLRPLSGAGVALAGGVLNLSFASGGAFFNGGIIPSFQPLPSTAVGGVVQIPLSFTSPLNVSMQGVFVDPSFMAGYRFTQGVELHVGTYSSAPFIPGPTGDDDNVSVDVTAGPTCWVTTGGIPFYGTTYTTIHVSSNGRVVFVSPDTEYSPSISYALSNDPFVGAWSDFDPSTAGTITISSPAPEVVRVDWIGVDYYSPSGTPNTFGIEFNAATGTVSLDGLTGIVSQSSGGSGNEDMFLGLSPGTALSATDPGAIVFTPGSMGGVLGGSDMLYDYYNYTSSAGMPPSLVPGTLNEIIFTPSTAFPSNYQWTGL